MGREWTQKHIEELIKKVIIQRKGSGGGGESKNPDNTTNYSPYNFPIIFSNNDFHNFEYLDATHYYSSTLNGVLITTGYNKLLDTDQGNNPVSPFHVHYHYGIDYNHLWHDILGMPYVTATNNDYELLSEFNDLKLPNIAFPDSLYETYTEPGSSRRYYKFKLDNRNFFGGQTSFLFQLADVTTYSSLGAVLKYFYNTCSWNPTAPAHFDDSLYRYSLTTSVGNLYQPTYQQSALIMIVIIYDTTTTASSKKPKCGIVFKTNLYPRKQAVIFDSYFPAGTGNIQTQSEVVEFIPHNEHYIADAMENTRDQIFDKLKEKLQLVFPNDTNLTNIRSHVILTNAYAEAGTFNTVPQYDTGYTTTAWNTAYKNICDFIRSLSDEPVAIVPNVIQSGGITFYTPIYS